MIKRIKKWFHNSKFRILLLIFAGVLFVLSEFAVIKVILHRNQINFIHQYKQEQQLLVDQVALRFKDKLLASSVQDFYIIRNLVLDVETSARRYWIFGKNNQIIYMKDEIADRKFDTIDSLINNNDDLHIAINSFRVGHEIYTVGICIEESYMLEVGQLHAHDFFIIILFLATSLLFTACIIISFTMIYKQRQKNEHLEELIIERNVVISKLTSKIKSSNGRFINSNIESDRKRKIYNKDVFQSLLKKIDNKDLIPINIIFIEMFSTNNYPFHDDFRKYVNQIFDVVKEEQIIAEISPGVFTLLIFKSNKEKTENVKNTLINVWGTPLAKTGVHVRIGISLIEEVGTNMEEVYNSIYNKIRES